MAPRRVRRRAGDPDAVSAPSVRSAFRLGITLLCAGPTCGQDVADPVAQDVDDLVAGLNHADARKRTAAYRTLHAYCAPDIRQDVGELSSGFTRITQTLQLIDRLDMRLERRLDHGVEFRCAILTDGCVRVVRGEL